MRTAFTPQLLSPSPPKPAARASVMPASLCLTSTLSTRPAASNAPAAALGSGMVEGPQRQCPLAFARGFRDIGAYTCGLRQSKVRLITGGSDSAHGCRSLRPVARALLRGLRGRRCLPEPLREDGH